MDFDALKIDLYTCHIDKNISKSVTLTKKGDNAMNKVGYYRVTQGMQLKDLVISTGYSMGHISHIENGSREPSREAMNKIAGALGRTVPEVFYTELSEAERQEMEARKAELRVGGADG